MAGDVSPRKRASRKVVVEAGDVFDPAYEAHRLRLSGSTWREVAGVTGYPNENACRMAVQAYLTRAAADLNKEQQAERLQVELDRLDALSHAYWPAAMAGDDKAAGVVLNVIRQRSKLLGLETKENESNSTKTIIIGGTPEQAVAGLREVVEGNVVDGDVREGPGDGNQ